MTPDDLADIERTFDRLSTEERKLLLKKLEVRLHKGRAPSREPRDDPETARRQKAALLKLIAEMKALPPSQTGMEFTSRDHDQILYGGTT